MKFSTTINHAGVASIGMIGKTDLVDWCLLDYIANFEACEKAKKLGDKVWINFKHLIAEMPMLGLNTKSSVSMRIEKLRKLGLLEKTQSVADQKLYIQTSELYKTASNFCAYTVLQKQPTVQTEKQSVRENEHKAVNQDYLINNLNQNPFSSSQPGEKIEISLTSEQQEVFDWAVTHSHWCTATVSLETFIHVYDFPNGRLKAQFNAHKKARTTSTVNGLQSDKSITKKSEVNHAIPAQQNQQVNHKEAETLRRAEFMKAEYSRNPEAVMLEIQQKGFFYKTGAGMFSRAEFEELGLLVKESSTTDVEKISLPKSINALTNKLLVNRNTGARA